MCVFARAIYEICGPHEGSHSQIIVMDTESEDGEENQPCIYGIHYMIPAVTHDFFQLLLRFALPLCRALAHWNRIRQMATILPAGLAHCFRPLEFLRVHDVNDLYTEYVCVCVCLMVNEWKWKEEEMNKKKKKSGQNRKKISFSHRTWIQRILALFFFFFLFSSANEHELNDKAYRLPFVKL